jgi:hypothetical protein
MPIDARTRNSQSDLRQALDQHLQKLPADAPLRRVIAAPDIQGKLSAFDRADALAIQEQASYRRVGRLALWAMMAGAVVGALVLLPIEFWSAGLPRRMIETAQALALILTFLAILWISLRKVIDHWMTARAQAEDIRGNIFRAILEADAGDADARQLLQQKLACFKDAHLDWQLAYFSRRGADHLQNAGYGKRFRAAGYTLSAISVLLGVAAIIILAGDLNFPVPKSIGDAARWLKLHEPGRWQLGLGAMASSVLAFASARSLMDQDDRNARCYAATAAHVERIRREGLAKAEAAAAAGRPEEVTDFCEKVQSVLSAEHLAWSLARPLGNPAAAHDVQLGRVI